MLVLTTEDKSTTFTILDDSGWVIKHIPRCEYLCDVSYQFTTRTSFRPFGIASVKGHFFTMSHSKLGIFDSNFNFSQLLNVKAGYNTHNIYYENDLLIINHTGNDCMSEINLVNMDQKFFSFHTLDYGPFPEDSDFFHHNAYCRGLAKVGQSVLNIEERKWSVVPGDFVHDLVWYKEFIYSQSTAGLIKLNPSNLESQEIINLPQYFFPRGMTTDGDYLYVFSSTHRDDYVGKQVLVKLKDDNIVSIVPLNLPGGVISSLWVEG